MASLWFVSLHLESHYFLNQSKYEGFMSAVLETYTKEEIQKQFTQLWQQYKKDKTQVLTKSAEAEKQQEQALVKSASQTTVPGIVNGMAELQLKFSTVLGDLSGQLRQETQRLQNLQQAIKVESQTLSELKELKIAAEAFEILKHEHAQTLTDLQNSNKQAQSALEQEQAQTQALWTKQAQTALEEQETFNQANAKAKAQREEEYRYNQARKLQLAADAFAHSKAALEYKLKEQALTKEKDWENRRQTQTKQAPQLEKAREKVNGLEEKVKQESQKAREKAIEKVLKDAKVDAELLEKEQAANIEVYELKISTLDSTIQDNSKQISELMEQLNAALERVQTLAAKAVSGNK
jgi:hypothetical protein